MSKFITEAKKAKLERDGGKQADSASVAKLTISDLSQRVNLAKAWGFSEEEAMHLVECSFEWWRKANRARMAGVPNTYVAPEPEPEPEQETEDEETNDPQRPPPGVG